MSRVLGWVIAAATRFVDVLFLLAGLVTWALIVYIAYLALYPHDADGAVVVLPHQVESSARITAPIVDGNGSVIVPFATGTVVVSTKVPEWATFGDYDEDALGTICMATVRGVLAHREPGQSFVVLCPADAVLAKRVLDSMEGEP